MNLRTVALLFFPLFALAAPPPQSIDLDMSANTRAFKLAWAEGTTPLIRCNMKNAGAAYTVTGWTGTLYMQATWEDTSIQAVPSTATSGSVIDFQLTANMTATSGLFFANFIMTDGTSTVEWQRGTVDVRDSPGTDGAGTLTLTTALNWGDYTYSNTGTEGPYRAGANVTFSSNADGSQNIIAADTLGGLTPTAGRILYGTGSAWATLAAGTSGYVLASQGAAAPIWSAAAGGVSDGDKGDITVSASGATWTVDAGVIGDSKLTTTGAAAGTYPVANVTVNAQGRLTSAATSSSADIQSALGSVYLPLSGGTITGDFYQTGGEFIVRGASATTIALESSAVGSADRGYLDFINDDGDIFSRIVGANTSATRGRMSFRIADNAGTLQTALTLDYDAGASFTGIITGNGSGLTALDATDLTGTIAAARMGEQRLLIGSRQFMLERTSTCGWADFVSGNFHSDAIQSAATSLQAFTLGSDPIEVPYSFAAFRTTIAARITWNADDADSTDAKITGYRLIGYPSPDLTGSPTTLLTASGLSSVVTGASTITKIDIDRSAFSSTTVPRYIVALVDGSIRSNGGTGTTARKMAVMSVEIFSE